MTAHYHLRGLGLCFWLHLALSGCGPAPNVVMNPDGGGHPDLSMPGGSPDLAGAKVMFNDVLTQVFMSCAKGVILTPCHRPGPMFSQNLDLTDANAYKSLLGNGSGATAIENPAKLLVKPDDPSHSFIIQKVTGNPPLGNNEGAIMPYGERPRLTQTQIDLLSNWIAEGAPNN